MNFGMICSSKYRLDNHFKPPEIQTMAKGCWDFLRKNPSVLSRELTFKPRCGHDPKLAIWITVTVAFPHRLVFRLSEKQAVSPYFSRSPMLVTNMPTIRGIALASRVQPDIPPRVPWIQAYILVALNSIKSTQLLARRLSLRLASI